MKIRHLILSYFLFFILTSTIYGQRELSFYTMVEVLREKKYDYHQKKSWVMLNILSLDEDENLSSPLISIRLLEKKFSKYQESEKKKREIQLKEWEEVLK